MTDAALKKTLRPIKFDRLYIRWLRYLIPLLLVGLAVHLLLPQIANLKQAWQTIRQMPWWLVALAVVAQVAGYGGSGYLLAALVAMLHERLTVLRGTLITLAGPGSRRCVGQFCGHLPLDRSRREWSGGGIVWYAAFSFLTICCWH